VQPKPKRGFIQNCDYRTVPSMSQGSASDKTGDMSDFIGSNNQYKGIITLLEVLKKMDEQGIMPPGASSQAPRPRRDLPPNATQIPPNYTRRNQSGDSDRRSQRGRVNRSGFRKRTREVRCRYNWAHRGWALKGRVNLKERDRSEIDQCVPLPGGLDGEL